MEDLARSRISSTSPYSNEPISCICRLGPKSIKDFDPKVILKRWLEAPFLEKKWAWPLLKRKVEWYHAGAVNSKPFCASEHREAFKT
jgi:hypothetical protein